MHEILTCKQHGKKLICMYYVYFHIYYTVVATFNLSLPQIRWGVFSRGGRRRVHATVRALQSTKQYGTALLHARFLYPVECFQR
jgi:hypothetical protein